MLTIYVDLHVHTHTHTYILTSTCNILTSTRTGMGTITLLNTDGSIRSRVGCMETFMCAGVGEGIEWRRFGQRVPLGNTTLRTVTVSSQDA